MYSHDDEGLGVIALAPVLGAISGIFGGNPKDANRISTNTRAYQQAISGHDGPFEGFASGLEFLRVHAVMNDPDGGWATQAATTDAANKYKQALAQLNPQAIINPGSIKTVPTVAGASTGATGGINPIGGITPTQVLTQSVGGMSLPVLAAGGLVLYLLTRRR